jgi:hypothetical protein
VLANKEDAVGGRKRLASFRLSRPIKERLEKYAGRRGLSMTAVLELLIRENCLTTKEEKEWMKSLKLPSVF